MVFDFKVLKKVVFPVVVSFFLFFSFFFSSVISASVEDLSSKKKNAIEHDQRTTDFKYALMSKYAYKDFQENEDGEFEKLKDLPDWKIYEVRTGNNGYYGVAFHNTKTHQLVVAHRGTNSL